MEYFKLLAPLFVISILFQEKLSAQSYPITEELYKVSEVVIQGRILRVVHLIDSDGTTSMYTITTDSIYKGSPRIHKLYMEDFIFHMGKSKIDSSLLNQTFEVTEFFQKCPYSHQSLFTQQSPKKEDHFSIGDTLMVFLNDNFSGQIHNEIPENTIHPYNLVDQYLGALPPTNHLVYYVRLLTYYNKSK